MLVIAIAIAGACSKGAATAPPVRDAADCAANAAKPVNVPIVALIATPEVFEGKLIEVKAFASIEFEGNGLYASEQDYLNLLDGVWLDIPKELEKDAAPLHRQYVGVVGTFTSKRHGHMGHFLGEIALRRIGFWSNPRCPFVECRTRRK